MYLKANSVVSAAMNQPMREAMVFQLPELAVKMGAVVGTEITRLLVSTHRQAMSSNISSQAPVSVALSGSGRAERRSARSRSMRVDSAFSAMAISGASEKAGEKSIT